MLHLPNPIVTLFSLFLPRHVRIIIFWHSDIIRQKTLKWIVQPLQRILCRRANKILTTSWNLAQNSNVISSFTEKLSILPLSVPVFLEDRGNIQVVDRPPSLSEIPSRFGLFLGRLSYYKGIDFLINAISRLSESDKEFPFVIAGDGPLVDKIKSDLKACPNPSVTFISRCG
jgi:rhamnosyl/mannosyltransferase